MKIDKKKIINVLKGQFVVIALVVGIIVFGLLNPAFVGSANIVNVLRQAAVYGVMACGMTFVLIGGCFDMAAGAVLSMTCVVMVYLHDIVGSIPALFAALAVGAVCGVLCGFFIGYLKMNSMIITLGIQQIVQGMILVFTRGQYSSIKEAATLKSWFSVLGKSSWLGIPVQIYLYILLIVICQIILTKTKFGRQLKAVGSNATAARYSGIDDKKIQMKAYIFNGLCIAIAGVLLASRTMAAQPNIGDGYQFDVLTACVLGGTSLLGGEGQVVKSFVGVLLMRVLYNGYIMNGLPYYVQWLSQCIIVLVVVLIDIKSKEKMVRA